MNRIAGMGVILAVLAVPVAEPLGDEVSLRQQDTVANGIAPATVHGVCDASTILRPVDSKQKRKGKSGLIGNDIIIRSLSLTHHH